MPEWIYKVPPIIYLRSWNLWPEFERIDLNFDLLLIRWMLQWVFILEGHSHYFRMVLFCIYLLKTKQNIKRASEEKKIYVQPHDFSSFQAVLQQKVHRNQEEKRRNIKRRSDILSEDNSLMIKTILGIKEEETESWFSTQYTKTDPLR